MTSKDLPALNAAVDKLMRQLAEKQDDLRRREAVTGRGWNPRAINRLRDEITSIEARLVRAERLQEEALCSRQ